MSARSRAAANLAWHLGDATGVDVNVGWDNPSGRPGDGLWRVAWTDGPSVPTMHALATQNARHVRPLDAATLRYSRRYTPTAWAAALIAMAHHGELPDTASLAISLVEHDLHDTDATAWAPHWPAAIELAQLGEQRPALIAETLIAAGVTKLCHETNPRPCGHCSSAMPEPASTGRPRRWCSPACRQAARRATGAVTKPRYETFCAACAEPITTTATGRPRRWCSPACRTRAWRTTRGTH
jgi:hypothetical protein